MHKNLKLRLNLVKRAIITYIPYQGSVIIIDINSDGTLVIKDNGISKKYTIVKSCVNDILHQELSGIFFEEYTDDEINDRDLDWKVEFYNRRKLDHIAYGTKDTPLHHYDNLYWLMIGIENVLAVDIGSKHIKSMCETKKEQIGKPAVVSEEMRSVYFDIMSKLVDKVMTKNEQPEKNIMISPLSLMFAMSILLEASDGDTQKEINAFFNNQHLCVAEGLKSLIEDSNRTISQLKTANGIYVDEEYLSFVKESFIQNLSDQFYAELLSANKNNSSMVINDWVNHKTNGMIQKLVNEGKHIDSIVLLNAMFFEANWAEEYEEYDIKEDTFYNADGTTRKVSMLCSEERTLLINSKVTGFLKPYKEKEYYFAGLLPNEGYSVESVLSEMSAEEWSMLFWKARRAKVDVKIPEYRFEYEKDLSGILYELGVSSAFDQTRSNLQNMITIDGSYVEGVVQKSYIEVSRKGTRAAVITGIIAVAGCILEDRYEVYLDRPFIFAIYQSHAGIPVFIGVVKTMDS